MVQTIDFRDRDFKGCPADGIVDVAITDHSVIDLVSTPSSTISYDNIYIHAKATSPASWSSGKYYLKLKLSFYKDDGVAGFNTLISSVSYPVLVYSAGEVSTTKTDKLMIPINLLDKKYKIRAQLVGGQPGYTFTGIEGTLFLHGRVDEN